MTTAGTGARRSPWWERRPALFLRESRVAGASGFRVTLVPYRDQTTRVVARGRLRVHAARPGEALAWHGFDIEIVYPDDYPFAPLDVRPLDPTIRRRRHQSGGAGAICYQQEELEPWVVGYGFAEALDGASRWFTAEVTGVFAHEVPAAELLTYVDRLSAHVREVLIPAHAVWDAPPARRGTFDWEWDRYGTHPSVAVIGTMRGPDVRRQGTWQPGAPVVPDADVRETNSRLWRALRLAQNEVKANTYTAVRGVWFSLDGEPAPFHDLAGLEAVLAAHAGVASAEFRGVVEALLDKRSRALGWLPVGLDYPPARRRATDTGPLREWLMVSLDWSVVGPAVSTPSKVPRARPGAAAGVWPGMTVSGIPSHPVRRADLRRRVGREYPGEDLARAHVVVVGVGALGSTVARSLAAMGVGRLDIVDPDWVSPGNVVRHEARLPDVGRRKVDAMADILRETNPYVEVTTLQGTRGQRGAFDALLLDAARRPSLVIAAVAQKAVDGQVDDVARRAAPPLPVLHAWVMAEAQLLRAFVTRPGETACLYCNGQYEADQRDGRRDWGYVPGPAAEAEPFFEASCAAPAFPGAGNANALAAHVVVEMALDVLHERLSNEASHWVFAGNRARSVDPACPVEPLTVVRRGFGPHLACPVCGGEEREGVTLTDEDTEAYRRAVARARGEGGRPSDRDGRP